MENNIPRSLKGCQCPYLDRGHHYRWCSKLDGFCKIDRRAFLSNCDIAFLPPRPVPPPVLEEATVQAVEAFLKEQK